MTFTKTELAAIDRLRRFQKRWCFLRWLLLVTGLFSAVPMVFCVYIVSSLVSRVHANNVTALDAWHLAEFHTTMILLTGVTSGLLVWTLSQWRTGNPVFALLIRLVDDAGAKKG